jgi:hypothetical protein
MRKVPQGAQKFLGGQRDDLISEKRFFANQQPETTHVMNEESILFVVDGHTVVVDEVG